MFVVPKPMQEFFLTAANRWRSPVTKGMVALPAVGMAATFLYKAHVANEESKSSRSDYLYNHRAECNVKAVAFQRGANLCIAGTLISTIIATAIVTAAILNRS